MRWLKPAFLISITLLLTFVLSTRFGTLPPVGDLFNPFKGFWQNMAQIGLDRDYKIDIDQIQEPVTILFDDRGVPRIFAENDYDLYFAQGYVHAKDRLWQLDFQSRAASGRLSEIMGTQTLDYDRYQRRIGMVYGAENVLEEVNKDPRTRTMLEAYSDGINYYIENLRSAHYPLEYKLTDSKPEKFTPLKTALLSMSMAQTLNFHPLSYRYTNTKALLPPEIFEMLYPEYPSFSEPVIQKQDWDFEAETISPPDEIFIPSVIHDLELHKSEEGVGSNSWAVSGSKTQSGSPILVNDPHLTVSLPSLWYEAQHITPDVNMYGVTVPGAPMMLIGFNKNLGWGSTNSGSFSMDIYEIEFRDSRKLEYLHDDEWLPVTLKVEEIKVRNMPTKLDTVRYTHHGPVVQPKDKQTMHNRIPQDHAIRWLSHDGSNEMLSYYLMSRAENLEEFQEAITHFDKPSQLKSYADVDGNIGNFNVGKFPVRFEGQGLQISDGRNSAYDWNKWIPKEHMPFEINPDRGYISSANQPIVDENYPYYMGFEYAGFSRARRINNVLSEHSNFDMDFMQTMLMDDHNLNAEVTLPVFISKLDKSELSESESVVYDLFVDWDFKFNAESSVAYFYQQWWDSFSRKFHKKLFGEIDQPIMRSNRSELAYLLQSGDYKKLPIEVDSLIIKSFQKTHADIIQQFGADPENWHYGDMRSVSINHLAYLPGFGRTDLSVGGHSDAINAFRGVHGPSWRMIVEFTDPVQARVIYPGGQTGNPAHPDFDKMIDGWSQGELFDINFISSPDDDLNKIKSIRMKP